ncbi:MAG: ornithine carbamoyltransferase [Gemmatimonadetes bacterium]|nr:ornithine carbamoyltransferase [Gemmatimonadota bacterium]
MARKDFLEVGDFSAGELYTLLDLARAMKSGRYPEQPLAGRTLAMLFEKSSTRTRVSFEVGAAQLGGRAIFLSSRDLQLGRGEPVRDTARVLSRYVDMIMIRTFAQAMVEELAAYASVPVINGLTDQAHPCQVLADVFTVQENFGADLRPRRVAWVGDGNNMANSWLSAAAVFGFELRLACPEGYRPDTSAVAKASAATKVRLASDPGEAVEGADVVNTDVWASMGQESEAEARARAFSGYTVDEALMERASSEAIFLHCLPAHRGEEVSDAVLEGPASRVFDQAENRLHVQKALMATLIRRTG